MSAARHCIFHAFRVTCVSVEFASLRATRRSARPQFSLGSQSDQGEHTIERLLSASLTCRLQQRSLFAYLTDVLHANIRGDPVPALT